MEEQATKDRPPVAASRRLGQIVRHVFPGAARRWMPVSVRRLDLRTALQQIGAGLQGIASHELLPTSVAFIETVLAEKWAASSKLRQLLLRCCATVSFSILTYFGAKSVLQKRRALLQIALGAVQLLRYLQATISARDGISQSAFLLDAILSMAQQLAAIPSLAFIDRWLHHLVLTAAGKKEAFNLIEILIAISIIVTFSGLVGVVYPKKLEESKESNALIDIHTISSSLVIFYSRSSRYPLSLEELTESGDLSMVPKDPWDNEYRYIPHLDWVLMLRAVKSGSSSVDYHVSCIQQAIRVLSDLPEKVDPMVVLVAASAGPVVFSLGKKNPVFGSSVADGANPARKKAVATMVQEVRNAAVANKTLAEALDGLKSAATS